MKFRLLSSMVVYTGVTALSLTAGPGCSQEQKEGPPPPDVEVIDVVQKDVPVYSEWVGTTDGLVNATIRPQVTGYLIKQNYKEGNNVKKGQTLFEIDPRTFQAELDQARGQLAQQMARWETAQANLKRIRPLAEQNAVSKKELDDAIGMEQSTHASVISAQAEVDKALLNLEFTKITSLIDGIAGIAKAQIGDLVGPGQIEELTTVSTVDPIKVYIPISEQEYLKAMKEGGGSGKQIPLSLNLADGSVYPHTGTFAYADRQVDVKTGTIRIAALFPNPGNLLRPGQFARIRATLKTKSGALLVPQRAVSELQGSYQVAVVDAENKVNIRPVKVAERVETLWVIEEGVKAGERVVAEGVQKVKNGMVVNPKPFGSTAAAASSPPAEQEKNEESKH
jgi:membrane fusion protein (multidrug efflux system)